LNVEGFECPEIRFCGSGFDEGEELSKSVRYCFNRGWVGNIAISPAEGLIIFKDFLAVLPCTWSEEVMKKECSFRRRTAGRGKF